MGKNYIPQPLFDTLENLSDELITQNTHPFARQDFAACFAFLKQYDGNHATFNAYRREVERLIQWAWYQESKSILVLTRTDLENYIQFCLKPPKSWIGLKKVNRFIDHGGQRIPNPAWRPFVATVSKIDNKKGMTPDKKNYALSQKALREIFTVLGSFYNYLFLENKVQANPVALIRQKSKYLQKQQQQATIMRLSDMQWEYCLKAAESLMQSQPNRHNRTLFIITALYQMYLRISELAASTRWTPQMGHFFEDSHQQWWFKTVGKGNKVRHIAVSDQMLDALKAYRKKLGFSLLPSPNDTTPLIPKIIGNGALASTRHLRDLVQDCFDLAIENLKQERLFVQADALESATVHWLRHTGISDDINKRGRPIAHVRDDAGHSSIAITDKYNDIVLIERHRSAKNKNTDTSIKINADVQNEK